MNFLWTWCKTYFCDDKTFNDIGFEAVCGLLPSLRTAAQSNRVKENVLEEVLDLINNLEFELNEIETERESLPHMAYLEVVKSKPVQVPVEHSAKVRVDLGHHEIKLPGRPRGLRRSFCLSGMLLHRHNRRTRVSSHRL